MLATAVFALLDVDESLEYNHAGSSLHILVVQLLDDGVDGRVWAHVNELFDCCPGSDVVVVYFIVELHFHEQLKDGFDFDCVSSRLLLDAVELDSEVNVWQSLVVATVEVAFLYVLVY